MLISKSVGIWGEGADEATFNLEIVGHTPEEVENLKKLVEHKDPSTTTITFENGTLKVELKFKRKVSLAVQAENKRKAEEADASKHVKAAQKAKPARKAHKSKPKPKPRPHRVPKPQPPEE
jgi:hypothetical protein